MIQVLPYFANSPFFDATSNNATLSTQALYNPGMYHLIQTREAFEGRLRTMHGLEFMVSHDPSMNDTQPEHNGVWVISKQNRRKRQGIEDEITPISSYFVVGENVYMAPSVANILGSRMVNRFLRHQYYNSPDIAQLSTVTSLNKLFLAASSLPIFSPARGHTYSSYVPKSNSLNLNPQTTQNSKESTPLPDTQGSLKSVKASSIPLKGSFTDLRGASLLAESFGLSLRYGKEYMDETPLVGEPGNFILRNSRDAPSQSQSQPPVKKDVAPSPAKASSPPTPTPLKTDIPPAPLRKGSKGGDKSPTTPGFKDKKGRKKSKVAVSTPK